MTTWLLDAARESGALALRAVHVLHDLVRGRIDRHETLRLVASGGRDVTTTAMVGSLLIGGIVGMQGLGYLSRYNATEVFGWAAAMSAFRDLGPLLLGFALAARVGARNTAEVAALATRERLDAMSALGLLPAHVVTGPRVLAVVVIALLLYAPCAIAILATACLLARFVGGQSIAISVWSAVHYVDASVIFEGLLRMAAFGVLLGLSSTHAGLALWQTSARGAADIGHAVFRGSVLGVAGIVVVNATLSLAGGTG